MVLRPWREKFWTSPNHIFPCDRNWKQKTQLSIEINVWGGDPTVRLSWIEMYKCKRRVAKNHIEGTLDKLQLFSSFFSFCSTRSCTVMYSHLSMKWHFSCFSTWTLKKIMLYLKAYTISAPLSASVHPLLKTIRRVCTDIIQIFEVYLLTFQYGGGRLIS